MSNNADSVSPLPSIATIGAEVTTEPDGAVSEGEISKFTYTDQQKKNILAAAQKAGLKTVYIPTIGGGSDDYLDLVEVKGNTLILKFVRMAIAQSSEEIQPGEEAGDVKMVQLTDKVNGKWIQAENGSSVEFLYFRIDKTYIKYFSAKPFLKKNFEASARSMIPLY
ncbi:hypothetical protein D3C73_1260880 [compost metagenome]